MCPTIVPLMRETKKEQDIYFTSLIETMKILVATEKPFAKKAVDGIRKIVEDAGYELALLEKYTDKGQLLEAVADVDALIVRSDKVTAEVIAAAKKAGVKLQVGFNRRFDHNHRAVYEAIRAGKVGKVNLVKISSRDPEPPTIDYVKVSGGIFYDMMVHDFDMARFLAGSEVTEVFAYGAVLVDPAIGEAGDVDTAVVSLKFANGAMGVIDNSRKAVYGYDQRVEVFGSEGAVMDENDTPNNATYYGADGTSSSPCYKIMWDRYTMAFAAEQRAFAEAVINGTETQVTGEDGLAPILIAAAATESMKEGRPVKISEIEE